MKPAPYPLRGLKASSICKRLLKAIFDMGTRSGRPEPELLSVQQTKSQRSGRNIYCKLNIEMLFASMHRMTVAASSATTPFPPNAMLTCRRIKSVPSTSYLSIPSTLHLGVRGYNNTSFLSSLRLQLHFLLATYIPGTV